MTEETYKNGDTLIEVKFQIPGGGNFPHHNRQEYEEIAEKILSVFPNAVNIEPVQCVVRRKCHLTIDRNDSGRPIYNFKNVGVNIQ